MTIHGHIITVPPPTPAQPPTPRQLPAHAAHFVGRAEKDHAVSSIGHGRHVASQLALLRVPLTVQIALVVQVIILGDRLAGREGRTCP